MGRRPPDIAPMNHLYDLIHQRASGNTLALVTCWPVDSMERGPMRLVVYAEAAKNPRRVSKCFHGLATNKLLEIAES